MAKHKTALLPHFLIVAASKGEPEAIQIVLNHFSGYITALSTRRMYDENGAPHLCVDEGMRRRLETKLITSVLRFRAA